MTPKPTTASSGEYIECRGIRTHNLKNIDINFPKGKWIAVTGVSGSGKSSLAFDTLFAESQRRFLETLGTYERQFLEGIPAAEFDSIENIPPAIAIKQSNRSNDPRSVIATATDLAEPMRLLFALAMEPSCARCGSAVTSSDINELRTQVGAILHAHMQLALAVSFEWPSINAAAMAHNMMAEGYSRIITASHSFDLNELVLLAQNNFPTGEQFLVLDRLVRGTDADEMENRLQTAWSQVRYSSRFRSLVLVPLSADGLPAKHNRITLETQPWCANCSAPTTTIQQGDLDWQSALGACKTCQGIGNVAVVDHNKVVPNSSLSIAGGAIKPWTSKTFAWMADALVKSLKMNGIDPASPWSEYSENRLRWIWTGEDSSGVLTKKSSQHVTLKEFFDTLEAERYKSTSRILLAKYRRYVTCPACNGTRVRESGQNARCAGKRFHEIMTQEISDVSIWLNTLSSTDVFLRRKSQLEELYNEVSRKIDLLLRLGLGSSSLWRRSKTLSGGEYQRVILTRVLGNGLTDALYVLDEPSVGLGRNEIPELIKCLRELRDLGNTVVMVEHDPALICAADDWIELGPGGGKHGGKILTQNEKTPRSANGGPETSGDSSSFKSKGALYLKDFSALNCQNLSAAFPLGALTVVTGPSGAGKSTLVRMGLGAALAMAADTGKLVNADLNIDQGIGTWAGLTAPPSFFENAEIISVDQQAAHRSISSVVATALDVMDFLRKQFAQSDDAHKFDLTAGDFSFNSTGACSGCEGRGIIEDDLFFLGEVKKECPDCHGQRYCKESLRARWQGKTISQWLSSTVDECLTFWDAHTAIRKQLRIAADLGLGYLPLGTSTGELSGGERQRLRIASALSATDKKMFCLLDEPTRGLSEYDIANLLQTILRLTRLGHTFVVAEHHERFCSTAHQLLIMGPGGGRHGGRIVQTLVGERNPH
jgi:excinuclease ABC subunit A